MKLLLDENLSHRLRPLLRGHDVFSVKYMGWREIANGALLAKAVESGFDAVLTMDYGIEYEQNLSALPCAVVIIEAESKRDFSHRLRRVHQQSFCFEDQTFLDNS